MTLRPTVYLTTSPHATKVLVRLAEDEVLKAVLLTPRTPHPRALPTLLEAMALWYQVPVHAVLCATEEASWCRLGLLDDLCLSADTVHYTVELRQRERERRQRIAGVGNFDDLRQLVFGGVR